MIGPRRPLFNREEYIFQAGIFEEHHMPLTEARVRARSILFPFHSIVISPVRHLYLVYFRVLIIFYIHLGGDAPQFVAGGGVEDGQVLRCHVGKPLKMQCIVPFFL